MEKEQIRRMIGKKVYLQTYSNRNYSATIDAVDQEGSPVIFVYLTDKFGKLVIINSEEIKLIQEEQ